MGLSFFSPVEQFDLLSFFYGLLSDLLDTSLTDYVYYVYYVCLLLIFFWFFCWSKSLFFPGWSQHFSVMCSSVLWVQFICEHLKMLGSGYFPFVLMVFYFIFLGNCLGLVPCGMAITSYLGLTLGLSLAVLVGCILLGIMRHHMSFFRLFVLNVNFYFLLFLVGLEIASYLMRGFSLGMSLGANMTAGHNLLHVLGSFCLDISIYSYIVICFVFFLLVFVLYLEFFVCGVQAYVYIVLFCIYVGDSLSLKGH